MVGFCFFAVLFLRKYTLKRAVIRHGKRVEDKDVAGEKKEEDVEAQNEAEDEEGPKGEAEEIAEESVSSHGDGVSQLKAGQSQTEDAKNTYAHNATNNA